MYQKSPEIGKGVDWLLVWLYAILIAIGLLCIFSVEYRNGDGVIQSFLGFKKKYSKQLLDCHSNCVKLVFPNQNRSCANEIGFGEP